MPAISVYTLMIINKSGGLVYSRDFEPSASRLDLNEALRVASVWHSVSEIARQLSPVPTDGERGAGGAGDGAPAAGGALVAMSADTFDLHCLPAPTGVRFVCVAAPGTPHVPHLLARVYEHYADYVVKDPFHERDQVIKAARFDAAVEAAVRQEHASAVEYSAAAAAAAAGSGGGDGGVGGPGPAAAAGGGGMASGLLGSLAAGLGGGGARGLRGMD